MAGIAGSHADSLAPVVSTTNDAAAGIEAQQGAKPIPMQAPPAPDAVGQAVDSTMNPQPQQIPMALPEPDYAAMAAHYSAAEPDYEAAAKKAMQPKTRSSRFGPIENVDVGEEALQALPAAGMAAGMIAGTAAGGLTGPAAPYASPTLAVAGGGIGKAAGTGLQGLIMAGLGRDEAPKTVKEQLDKMGPAAASGALEAVIAETGGALLKSAFGLVAKAPALASKFVNSPMFDKMATKSKELSASAVATYKKAADQVNALLDQYGPELNVASADLKKGMQDGIMKIKGALSDKITELLKDLEPKAHNPVMSIPDAAPGAQTEMQFEPQLQTTAYHTQKPNLKASGPSASMNVEQNLGPQKTTSGDFTPLSDANDKGIFAQHMTPTYGADNYAAKKIAAEGTQGEFSISQPAALNSKNSAPVQPLIDKLASFKEGMSDAVKASPEGKATIEKIDGMIKQINDTAKGGERITYSTMHDLKNIFYKQAEGTWEKGVYTGPSDLEAKAAKSVGLLAKNAVSKASPEIAALNEAHQEIHNLGKKFTKVVLNPEGGDGEMALLGRGTSKFQPQMRALDEITSTDFSGEAKTLNAAKEMQAVKAPNVMKLPSDIYNAIVHRQLSPSMVKTLIDTAKIPAKVVESLGGADKLMGLTKTQYGQVFVGQLLSKIHSGKSIPTYGKPLDVTPPGQ